MNSKSNVSEPSVRAYDIVLNFIKSQIIQKKLKLGDKLPSERFLMQKLSLSRNSVREALRQLENMGFIKSVHGQGTFLINNSREGISSIFSMLLLLQQTNKEEFLNLRKTLEIAALENAILFKDSDKIANLKIAIQNMEDAENLSELEKAENLFHKTLISLGNNRIFTTIMEALSTLEESYRHETLKCINNNIKKELLDIHKNIVVSIENNDIKNAKEALIKHFEIIK